MRPPASFLSLQPLELLRHGPLNRGNVFFPLFLRQLDEVLVNELGHGFGALLEAELLLVFLLLFVRLQDHTP